MRRTKLFPFLLVIVILSFGCGHPEEPVDPNVSVPAGDPSFPPLRNSWVIDKAGILETRIIGEVDAIFQRLQEDGIAEVVVVTMRGVKKPEEWATHYGRWLKLGKRGMSAEGGNNGIVWLIRPDADLKVTVSVGRGLPKFTAEDYSHIIDAAVDYLNFGNGNSAVLAIGLGTDATLRKLYERKEQGK